MRSAAAAAVAALLLVPAAAPAATVEVPKRCYAEGDSIDVAGTGFTPNGDVRLTLERSEGEVLETSNDPVAGADGAVKGDYGVKDETGWFEGSQTRFDMLLRLTDLTDQSITASTSFIFSRWNVGISAPGGKMNPRARAGILAVGFTNAVGKPLFAHWLRNGKRVFTKRLGILRGPCGDLKVRLSRGFPFRPVPAGNYEVRFSPSRTNFQKSTIRHRAARVRRSIP